MRMRLPLFVAIFALNLAAHADLTPSLFNAFTLDGSVPIGRLGSVGPFYFVSVKNPINGQQVSIPFTAFLTPTTVVIQTGTTFYTPSTYTPFPGFKFVGQQTAIDVNGITLDPSSNLLGIVPSYVDAYYIGPTTPRNLFSSISFDFSNVDIEPGKTATFNLSFASSPTPEPSSMLLLLTGILGVPAVIRHRLPRTRQSTPASTL